MQGPGGGFKVNLLRNGLTQYQNDNKTIIIFTDRWV